MFDQNYEGSQRFMTPNIKIFAIKKLSVLIWYHKIEML